MEQKITMEKRLLQGPFMTETGGKGIHSADDVMGAIMCDITPLLVRMFVDLCEGEETLEQRNQHIAVIKLILGRLGALENEIASVRPCQCLTAAAGPC